MKHINTCMQSATDKGRSEIQKYGFSGGNVHGLWWALQEALFAASEGRDIIAALTEAHNRAKQDNVEYCDALLASKES